MIKYFPFLDEHEIDLVPCSCFVQKFGYSLKIFTSSRVLKRCYSAEPLEKLTEYLDSAESHFDRFGRISFWPVR